MRQKRNLKYYQYFKLRVSLQLQRGGLICRNLWTFSTLFVKCVHQIRGGPTTRDLLGESRETKSPLGKMSAELELFSVLFVA